MRRKSLTKEERQVQILQYFTERIRVDNWKTASIAEIAKGIGMSPSSHLRKLCEPLAADHTLIKKKLKRSGRWDGWGYKPSTRHFKKPERTVVFNFHQHGQKIEMRQLL